MKTNKKEFVASVAEIAGSTKKDAAHFVEAFIEATKQAVTEEGSKLQLVGFLTAQRVHKPAAVKRNPQTGEPVNVPEGTKLKAKLTF